MKKYVCLILISIMCVGMLGCNYFSITFGGTQRIEIQKNKKVMNAFFDGSNVWILTRKRNPDEVPECYTMKEYSNIGALSGEIIICEK